MVGSLRSEFQEKSQHFSPKKSGARNPGQSGSTTYRRKEHKKLDKEVRREHDQEIHRRVLHNLIEDHRKLGSPGASRFATYPNNNQERQEVFKSLFV